MLALFLKGLAIGAVIAMPFGAVGMLCLQRAIVGGVRIGLFSGLGAAAADAFYGAVAAFGLTFVSGFLSEHAVLLQRGGGLFLVAMAARLILSHSPPNPVTPAAGHYAGACASVFLLTLANPMNVVGFLAIFAGFGLGRAQAGTAEASAVVAGVFCGSMVWWVAIAFGGKLLRFRLLTRMRAIRRGFGAVIAAFGLWAVLSTL